MSMIWGVYEQWDDDDEFISFHVMPCVVIEGEDVRSGDHELSKDCPCGPLLEVNNLGYDVLTHHAPDHPGAFSDDEWKKKEAQL